MKLEAAQRLLALNGKDATDLFSAQAIAHNANVGFKSRDKLISIKITDFLIVAEHGYDREKERKVEELLNNNVKFNTVPYLYYDYSGGAYAKCSGHEGRHRARALLKRGYTTIPVELRGPIRWSEQTDPDRFDYREEWPEFLLGQDDGKIPFPVARQDADKPYRGS